MFLTVIILPEIKPELVSKLRRICKRIVNEIIVSVFRRTICKQIVNPVPAALTSDRQRTIIR